jgi:hypothetical protein
VSAAPSPKTETTTLHPPVLRETRLTDYQNIRRLVHAHGFELPPFEDWRSLWADNPLRSRFRKDLPLGWVLETRAGEIVGTMGTAHALYKLRGEDLVSAVGRFWFVAEPYRGFALQLMDEYFSQREVDLYINNTVAPDAIASFSQLSAPVPVGDWVTGSYWVTCAPARLRAHPVGATLALGEAVSAKSLPRIPARYTIESIERFDSRFDVFWHENVRQNSESLLAERSSAALCWHFNIPIRSKRLWIFTASRNGRLSAYCTLTQQDHAFRLPALPLGDTYQFRGMRLVDFQSIEPETDLLPGLLAAALQRCAAEDVFILENLACGVPKMRVVDECAPYRKQLENWKFYYRAADPALDDELCQPKFWDPSAFDGDASFE